MRRAILSLLPVLLVSSLAGANSTLPLTIEGNRGQAAPNVRFLARTEGGALAFTDAGVKIRAGKSELSLTPEGASKVAPTAESQRRGVLNVFHGKTSIRGIPTTIRRSICGSRPRRWS